MSVDSIDTKKLLLNPSIFTQKHKSYLRITELNQVFNENVSKTVNRIIESAHDPKYDSYTRKRSLFD